MWATRQGPRWPAGRPTRRARMIRISCDPHAQHQRGDKRERERRGSTLCSAFLPSLHPSIHHLCLPDRDWAPQVDGWNLAHVGHVEQEDLHEMLIAKSLFPLLCDAAEEWWWWRRQNQWIILKQGWWRWPRSRGWWPSLRRRRTSWWDADISAVAVKGSNGENKLRYVKVLGIKKCLEYKL